MEELFGRRVRIAGYQKRDEHGNPEPAESRRVGKEYYVRLLIEGLSAYLEHTDARMMLVTSVVHKVTVDTVDGVVTVATNNSVYTLQLLN